MKRQGPHDPRQDADDEPATQRRVDRVFGPPPREIAAVPVASEQVVADESEMQLRRQVTKLQRQLADALREVADVQEQLQNECEFRLLITAARDKLATELEPLQYRIAELLAEQAQMQDLAQQLADDNASNVERLSAALAESEAKYAAAEAKMSELHAEIEDASMLRIEERARLVDRHSKELERIDQERQQALVDAEALYEARHAVMREQFDAEVAELHAAHERSIALLRGEVEPKLLEARVVAEERERLANELATVRREAERELGACRDVHARDFAQLAEKHASEMAALARTGAAELSRALGERDVEILEHQQTLRKAELKERELDDTIRQLRGAQEQLRSAVTAGERKLAETTAAKTAVDERLLTATLSNERLAAEMAGLRGRIDQFERDARHASAERKQLIGCLQDGLMLLGVGNAEDLTDQVDEAAAAAREEEQTVEVRTIEAD